MKTGDSVNWPDFIYLSITIINSCARPTAGIGMRTFPPPLRISFTDLINAVSTSSLVGCMSSFAPYVLSISNVSTRGNRVSALSKSMLFPYLISPE